jgi:ATP-dependent RNA helicase DDX27
VRLGVENFKQVVPSKLRQEFVRIRPVHEADREAMLFALLSRSFTKRCIVFVQTKWHAHRLRLLCGLFGLRASELHGNLTQLQRLESLQQFKDEEVRGLRPPSLVDGLLFV